MPIQPILTTLRSSAKRRALAAIILAGLATPAIAEVVDLPTTLIFSPQQQEAAEGQPIQAGPQVPQTDPSPNADASSPLQPLSDAVSPSSPSDGVSPQQGGTPATNQADADQAGTDALNADPDADIEELQQGLPTPTSPLPSALGAGRQLGLGATAASFSAAPTMIGDLFGGSFSQFGGAQTVNFTGYAQVEIVSGAPGSAASSLAFEFGSDIVPNDIFSVGGGTDASIPADGNADTFSIAEPIPPTDAPTSPGPGFLFDGGTAVFTGNTSDTTAQPGVYTDDDLFYIAYSYTQSLSGFGTGTGAGRPIPGPGTAARRVKIPENFSPEVRDRCFVNYSFFNDAFAGLGDISRYTVGFERILVDRLFSLEVRLPMAGTYASRQALDQSADRDFELGNAALISKAVLLRTNRLLWSGGLGLTIPTADDTRIFNGNAEVLRVENETVHLLPYTAFLLRHSRDTSIQAYLQFDVATNGDPVLGDLTGATLPQIGTFHDSTLVNVDTSISHVLFRNQNRSLLQQVIGNAELHYTGTLEASDFVTDGSLTYTNLKRHFNVVNATAGMHFVLANNWVVTPAMSVPLRDGLDEQFDYEAQLQVNWLR